MTKEKAKGRNHAATTLKATKERRRFFGCNKYRPQQRRRRRRRKKDEESKIGLQQRQKEEFMLQP